jgi:putative membrane protein
VTVPRLLSSGFGLWCAAQLVGGIALTPGPDPLRVVGTLIVLALLLRLVEDGTRPARHALAARLEPLPVGVVVLVLVNAGLFWLTVNVAAAAGLDYRVDGFFSALLGSLVVLLVGWLLRPSPARR